MSSTPTPSTSRSNLDSIFSSAFQAYKKKTGKDITSLPLAAEIESCHSPDAILAVLRSQISVLDQSQSDEGSTKWLIPTINVLYSFSAALGEGVGLVHAVSSLLKGFCSNVCPSGVLANKSHFCGNRCSSFGRPLFRFPCRAYFYVYSRRLLKMSAVAKIFLSIYSTGSNTSSVGLRFTRRSHLLQL